MLSKWLREPLLHFLLIGALLFIIFGLKNNGISDQSKRIVFTQNDIQRLGQLWEKQRQRPPTQIELEGLIEQQIREQVLYREALAMGLDRNDSIVRRRLAQKVEFISSDLAAQVEPSEADLAEYLASHSEQFAIPGHISFTQIYLSADRRGADIEDDATRLLAGLEETGTDTDITELGDPFMFGQRHEQLTEADVSRLFGEDFASKIFSLPVGHWQGPVRSAYGLHLLYIENRTTASPPDLAAVRDKVRNEWLNQQRNTIDDAFYNSLRQRYEIIIEDDNLKGLSASAK
ncbi:MAG TPA: peptidyl-prolyl cis-trans isomerase [Gammaproteobacteria bacterium]|nr:peptidyl-prolyl cis-trans isomerase [Gammaproteobacteria bacterium]